MTVTDTPDWSKPLPGGSRLILNDSFNLLSGGGQYVSGWMDVNAFSGIYIETNGFDLASDYGSLEVQFQDAAGVQPILAKYDATWRGDLVAKLNVPVLGAQARIVITGPAHNVNAAIVAIGHGGGPSSSVGPAGAVLLGGATVSVPASTQTVAVGATVTERPAIFTYYVFNTNFTVHLQALSSSGVANDIYVDTISAAFVGKSVPVYLPPRPIQVLLDNGNAAAVSAIYAVTTARL